ncbi:MAG: nucleotidyltransferase domain-containing protein [Alphaproteobacteria bacterium]|nr:nucleotidyltransferase domain-containing protein [Alphaproteobacteria bacterium]
MHPAIAEQQQNLGDLCRRFGVKRLDVFGSAARAADFDPAASDVDLLVEFDREDDLARFLNFKRALEDLLARRIDLVDRKAVEASRNYIRRRHILGGAEPLYAG